VRAKEAEALSDGEEDRDRFRPDLERERLAHIVFTDGLVLPSRWRPLAGCSRGLRAPRWLATAARLAPRSAGARARRCGERDDA
jgi:hypothetical protein